MVRKAAKKGAESEGKAAAKKAEAAAKKAEREKRWARNPELDYRPWQAVVTCHSDGDLSASAPKQKSFPTLLGKAPKNIDDLQFEILTADVHLQLQAGHIVQAQQTVNSHVAKAETYKCPEIGFQRDYQKNPNDVMVEKIPKEEWFSDIGGKPGKFDKVQVDGNEHVQNLGIPFLGSHCAVGALRNCSGEMYPIFEQGAYNMGTEYASEHFRKSVRCMPYHMFFYRPNGKLITAPDLEHFQQPSPKVQGFQKYEVILHPWMVTFTYQFIPKGPFRDYLANREEVKEAIYSMIMSGLGGRRSAGFGPYHVAEITIRDWSPAPDASKIHSEPLEQK